MEREPAETILGLFHQGTRETGAMRKNPTPKTKSKKRRTKTGGRSKRGQTAVPQETTKRRRRGEEEETSEESEEKETKGAAAGDRTVDANEDQKERNREMQSKESIYDGSKCRY